MPDAETDAPAFGEGAEPAARAGFARTLNFAFKTLSLYHEGLAWLERALAALPAGSDLYIGSPRATQRGEPRLAARLLGASDVQFAVVARLRHAQEQFVYERTRELLQARLEPEELTQLLNDGRAAPPEEMLAEAMRL